METKRKILLLSATVGAGHNMAANTIAKKFASRGHDAFVLDMFAHDKEIQRCISDWGLKFMYNNPKLARTVYSYYQKKNFSFFDWFDARVKDHLIQRINDFAPDVIISCHIAGHTFTHIFKPDIKKPFTDYFLATDYDMPPSMRPLTDDDYIIVPSEDFKNELIEKGYDARRLLPFGIPIDEKYYKKLNKTDTVKKLGLKDFDPNKKTLLFMSGEKSLGKLFGYLKQIAQENDFQIITVCGRNVKLKNRIDKAKHKWRSKIYNYGFQQNIDELMTVSDFMFGKAGGLSSTEAIAKGLKIISFKNIPPPEYCNLLYLEKTGHAIIISEIGGLVRLLSPETAIEPPKINLVNNTGESLYNFHFFTRPL